MVIHEITGLPVEALAGRPLETFSTEERLTWASGRQTTEPEDEAYCLLGIFDVHLPLIYGEGKDNALRRLHKKLGKARRIDVAQNTKAAAGGEIGFDTKGGTSSCWQQRTKC